MYSRRFALLIFHNVPPFPLIDTRQETCSDGTERLSDLKRRTVILAVVLALLLGFFLILLFPFFPCFIRVLADDLDLSLLYSY